MDDGIEHGVVVIVLGHFFVADVGLLIAEIDRHAVRAVEGWVVVVEDSVSDHKGDVASFDGSSLSILSSDVGVLAAAHCKENCPAQEVCSGPGSFVTCHAHSVAEHDRGHGLLVFTWWVGLFVPRSLAADVLV